MFEDVRQFFANIAIQKLKATRPAASLLYTVGPYSYAARYTYQYCIARLYFSYIVIRYIGYMYIAATHIHLIYLVIHSSHLHQYYP